MFHIDGRDYILPILCFFCEFTLLFTVSLFHLLRPLRMKNPDLSVSGICEWVSLMMAIILNAHCWFLGVYEVLPLYIYCLIAVRNVYLIWLTIFIQFQSEPCFDWWIRLTFLMWYGEGEISYAFQYLHVM